jgi:hypothetical protein
MKINAWKFSALALAPVAMLAMVSCSTPPAAETRTTVSTQKGVPGGTQIDTYELTAKVTAVNADNRHMTLLTRDGVETALVAGPEVVNFPQIQVGDEVKVVVARETVVAMRDRGVPSNDGVVAVAVLAPVGDKPGGVVAGTEEVTVKIEALDLTKREATLRFPNGRAAIFTVRKDVDMSKAKLGDEVVICVTEAMAISVGKP